MPDLFDPDASEKWNEKADRIKAMKEKADRQSRRLHGRNWPPPPTPEEQQRKAWKGVQQTVSKQGETVEDMRTMVVNMGKNVELLTTKMHMVMNMVDADNSRLTDLAKAQKEMVETLRIMKNVTEDGNNRLRLLTDELGRLRMSIDENEESLRVIKNSVDHTRIRIDSDIRFAKVEVDDDDNQLRRAHVMSKLGDLENKLFTLQRQGKETSDKVVKTLEDILRRLGEPMGPTYVDIDELPEEERLALAQIFKNQLERAEGPSSVKGNNPKTDEYRPYPFPPTVEELLEKVASKTIGVEGFEPKDPADPHKRWDE